MVLMYCIMDISSYVEMNICRYDHTNKGELTTREWFNVIKIQNKVDISLEQVEIIDCVVWNSDFMLKDSEDL